MPDAFLRIPNSLGGHYDVVLGPKGSVLTSNGENANGDPIAPTFQLAPRGAPPFRGFSYNHEWELSMLVAFGGHDFGIGNFTAEFEREMLAAGVGRFGPACYTNGADVPWTKRI